jgi:hypothetical protein
MLYCAAFSGLLISGCSGSGGGGGKPGKPAPEITGEDIDGKPMKLSDFRGQVVLLDFWGNW